MYVLFLPICIYIYTERGREEDICIYIYIYIYAYIYIQREGGRKRERLEVKTPWRKSARSTTIRCGPYLYIYKYIYIQYIIHMHFLSLPICIYIYTERVREEEGEVGSQGRQ